MVFGPSPSGPSLGHGSLPSGSLVRLRELGREQRALFASMPMDVQVSLTALNETFVSEYGCDGFVSVLSRHSPEVAQTRRTPAP